MNIKDFEVGQGVVFSYLGREFHAVVMEADNEKIRVARALSLNEFDRCYDDVDAVRSKHKDNVRLRDCPPPFTELYSDSPLGVYVKADMYTLLTFSQERCDECNVQFVDDGFLLTDDMMKELCSHPWREDMHKEKSGFVRFRGDGSGRRLPTYQSVNGIDDCQFGE